ncbi:17838_t:CDS:2 [Funneliformis geosporum]|uniref:17838_t:CDS:1 n=1 Tax=Funneliformis geosporum TaxID=1117311 RepID=A0A9W4SAC4_9GLOM|nr:17838_t:CDS:2 [Funneliformis geosporum]
MGELVLQDYPDLTEINLANHQLTALSINNCPNLKIINLRNNQLTKLELNTPNLEEIIAGQNELTTLDLTNCQQLKNIINTLVNLNQNFEELKEENKGLMEIVKVVKEGAEEKGLVITEAIQTKARTSGDYQKLIHQWNQGEDYNAEYDFDGSLDRLMQLLRVRNYLREKENKQITKSLLAKVVEANLPKERIEEKLGKIKLARLKELERKLVDHEEIKEELKEQIKDLETEFSEFKQKSAEEKQELENKYNLADGELKKWQLEFNQQSSEQIKQKLSEMENKSKSDSEAFQKEQAIVTNLREKNHQLWFAINNYLKATRTKKYALMKPVLTIKQAREFIVDLLIETEKT